MRCLILWMCWLSFVVQAQPVRLITVIEPPVSYLDSHGKPVGFAVDVVKAVQHELGDKTPIEVMPEARAIYIARTEPNVLLFSFSRTPERENEFYWITPLVQKSWSVYGLTTNPIQVQSLEQLKQVTAIGVVRGDIREEWLNNLGFKNLSKSVNHQQNLDRLLAGRLDLIAYESQGIRHLLQEASLSLDAVRPVFVLQQSDVYLLMSKTGTSPELAERWRMAADKIRRSGSQQFIAEKWQLQLKHFQDMDTEIQNGVLVFK
ncbi:transporter substrate-binding domain-containing protein [Rheinheimera sp.]|uniref:substrate-binding periplasmic protein n=1 Tax=Rheinheimera sp. TaxID=1869214 RepID=UPI00307F281B